MSEKRIIDVFLKTNTVEKKNKFSLVIPVYGVNLEYVRDCVDSIFSQSYDNWEICFCNDNDPTPNVSDYISKLAQRYPENVKITKNETNMGICIATKEAAKLATGDYLVLIDCDDFIHKRALQIANIYIEKQRQPDFLYTYYDVAHESGVRLFPIAKPIWSPETLLSINYINHLKLIKSTFYNKHKHEFFDPTYELAQDHDLCLKIGMLTDEICRIPFFLYHWRQREGSVALSGDYKPTSLVKSSQARDDYLKQIAPTVTYDKKNMSVIFREKKESSMLKQVLCIKDIQSKNKNELSFPRGSSSQEVINELLRIIKKSSCDYIQFFRDEVLGDQGTLVNALSYLEIPKVGLCYPFHPNGIPRTYNLKKDILLPTAVADQLLSWLNHNTLTGPLSGLLGKTSHMKILLEHLQSKTAEFAINRPTDLDRLAAEIGIANFMCGFRAVTINNYLVDQGYKPIEKISSINLRKDPCDFHWIANKVPENLSKR